MRLSNTVTWAQQGREGSSCSFYLEDAMKILLSVILVAFIVPPVWAILGDLDRDGVVDFDDFFLFVDNFGKEGIPEPLDTVVVVQTVVDTVVIDSIYVRPGGGIIPIDQSQSLIGVIPDLALVEISSGESDESINWDADIEDDGIRVWLTFVDVNGNDIYFAPNDVVVQINVKFFAAASRRGESKTSDDPFFEKDVLLAPGVRADNYTHTVILLAFEEFVPHLPSDIIITPAVFAQTLTAVTVIEVALTQSDGSIFSDRQNIRVAIEENK